MYRYRVMVVDDEPEVLEILSIALREKYDVVTAANGLDALEKLEEFEPDLMVTDVMMPLMNGWELITEVRRRSAFHSMPVIFLTALNTRKDIMAGYKAGADLYLTKPFDPLRIRKNIDVFIEKTPPPQRARRHSWSELSARLLATPPPAAEPRRPAAPTPPPKEAPAPAPSAPAPAMPQFDIPTRLFIVDDDEELLEVLRMSYEDQFEVFTATDGLEAVKKIPHYQPDIFVIDGMLPKMTGYQLCDTLRRSSAYKESPIVFISAKSDPKTRETMKRFGLVDYLAKPFDAPQLLAVLQRICRQMDFAPRIKKFSAEELRTEEQKAVEEKKIRERQKDFEATKSVMKDFLREQTEGERPHE
jgi:DNA-binding response OmpR family regulator